MNFYSTFLCLPFISKALIYGLCVSNGITQFYLPPTPEPFIPQPQSVTTRWLVLIDWYSPTRDGQAELTWVAGYMPR